MSETHKTNPFSVLGLPMKFKIDAAIIERAYLGKLQSAHPDAGGPDGDGEHGGDDAAALNQARKSLLDPELRANALLDLIGGPGASACKDLPDGFLMEMMTRRQEIEEQIDEAGALARTNWESWAREERTEYTQDVQKLFEQCEVGSEPEKRTQIRVLLNAWRYIERLIEQLDPDYNPARSDFR